MKYKALVYACLISTGTLVFGDPANSNSKPIFDMEQKYWRVTKVISPKITPDVDGCVLIKYDIDSNGTAINLVVIASEPKKIHDKVAMDALKKYKFKATVLNKEKISVSSLNMATFIVGKHKNDAIIAEKCYQQYKSNL